MTTEALRAQACECCEIVHFYAEPDEAAREAITQRMAEAIRREADKLPWFVSVPEYEFARAAYEAIEAPQERGLE